MDQEFSRKINFTIYCKLPANFKEVGFAVNGLKAVYCLNLKLTVKNGWTVYAG